MFRSAAAQFGARISAGARSVGANSLHSSPSARLLPRCSAASSSPLSSGGASYSSLLSRQAVVSIERQTVQRTVTLGAFDLISKWFDLIPKWILLYFIMFIGFCNISLHSLGFVYIHWILLYFIMFIGFCNTSFHSTSYLALSTKVPLLLAEAVRGPSSLMDLEQEGEEEEECKVPLRISLR